MHHAEHRSVRCQVLLKNASTPVSARKLALAAVPRQNRDTLMSYAESNEGFA